MANLLERASIVLTPTGFNNGEALCVKPDDGSGDFQFSRNSAATRVNAQGLVENVQILSSNLVQNGDFSEQGSEQIVNGTFDENVNGWVVNNANATFVWQPDKTALFTSTSFGYVRVFPSLNLNAAIYKVSFDILSFDGTLSNVHIGLGTNGNVVSAIGSYTYYYTSTGGSTEFQIRPNSGGTGSIKIDNISVKEVGQNWTLDSGWSIGDDKVIGTAATGDSYQDLNFAGTKTFKITFDCVVDSGQFAIRFIDKQWISASGTYTIYETTNSQRLFIDGRASFPFTGSVTNISVIEITDDTNLPRINYESGCGSWLFEPQSTNLITQSELFSNSFWIKSRSTFTDNATQSPSGANNMGYLKENTSASNTHYMRGFVTLTNGVNYTLSVFAKAKERNIICLGDNAAAQSSTGVWFDLTNGVVLTQRSGYVGSIKDFGNGIYRCSVTYSASSSRQYVDIALSLSDGVNIYTGDGTSGVYIWGAQLEQQSYATSYIPTDGTSVTRNRDVCNNGGSLASINSTEGVLYAEIAALANDGTSRVISLSDSSDTNRVHLFYNVSANTINVNYRVAGSSKAIMSFVLSDVTIMQKIAYRWKSGNFKLYINGVSRGTDTNTVMMPSGTMNQLAFNVGGGTSNFYGKTKALAVWKEALSDEELTELTQV